MNEIVVLINEVKYDGSKYVIPDPLAFSGSTIELMILIKMLINNCARAYVYFLTNM